MLINKEYSKLHVTTYNLGIYYKELYQGNEGTYVRLWTHKNHTHTLCLGVHFGGGNNDDVGGGSHGGWVVVEVGGGTLAKITSE